MDYQRCLKVGLYHKTRGGRNTFGVISEDAMVRVTKGVGKRLQLRVEFMPYHQTAIIRELLGNSDTKDPLRDSLPDGSVPFSWSNFHVILEELSNTTTEIYHENSVELDPSHLLVRPPRAKTSASENTEPGESLEIWEEVNSHFEVDERPLIAQCELKLFHLSKTLRFRVEYKTPNLSYYGYSYMFYTHDSGKSKKIAFGTTKTIEDTTVAQLNCPDSPGAPSNYGNHHSILSELNFESSLAGPDTFGDAASPLGVTPSFTPSITSDYDESSAESPHHHHPPPFDTTSLFQYHLNSYESFGFQEQPPIESSGSSCSSSSGHPLSDSVTPEFFAHNSSTMDFETSAYVDHSMNLFPRHGSFPSETLPVQLPYPRSQHSIPAVNNIPPSSSSSSVSSDDGIKMVTHQQLLQSQNGQLPGTRAKSDTHKTKPHSKSGKSSNATRSNQTNLIQANDFLDDAAIAQKLSGKGPNKRKKRKNDQISTSDPLENSEYPYCVPGSLDVQGVVRAQSFVQFSDIRFKTNVEDITDALNIVTQLRGKKYEWKDSINGNTTSKGLSGGKKVIGLIAQEVKRVLPEAVLTDKNGYLSLNYTDMVPLLIEALKQHVQDSAADKTVIKEEMAELRAKVDELSIRSGGDSCTETSSYIDDISDYDENEIDTMDRIFDDDESYSSSFQEDLWEVASSGSASERSKSTNFSGISNPRERNSQNSTADGGSLSRSGSPLSFRRSGFTPSPSSSVGKPRQLSRVPSYSSAGSRDASIEIDIEDSSDEPRFVVEESILSASSASFPDAPVDASCEIFTSYDTSEEKPSNGIC